MLFFFKYDTEIKLTSWLTKASFYWNGMDDLCK